MRQKWHDEDQKKLHQVRIGEDVKQSIRTLSIIEDTSISDVTEQALRSWINSNSNRIQKYHLDMAQAA